MLLEQLISPKYSPMFMCAAARADLDKLHASFVIVFVGFLIWTAGNGLLIFLLCTTKIVFLELDAVGVAGVPDAVVVVVEGKTNSLCSVFG